MVKPHTVPAAANRMMHSPLVGRFHHLQKFVPATGQDNSRESMDRPESLIRDFRARAIARGSAVWAVAAVRRASGETGPERAHTLAQSAGDSASRRPTEPNPPCRSASWAQSTAGEPCLAVIKASRAASGIRARSLAGKFDYAAARDPTPRRRLFADLWPVTGAPRQAPIA